MKLSDIVRYKNQLDSIKDDQEYRLRVDQRFDELLRMVRNEINIRNLYEISAQQRIDQVQKSLLDFEQELQTIGNSVDQLIEELQPRYFEHSYKWYATEMHYETTGYILNRRMIPSAEEYDIFTARIKSWADWAHPGLCIRPGIEDFITSLVACGPLYIVDQNHDLLLPCMERFNSHYQRHLRPYIIKEVEAEPILSFLPNAQFGLVVAYNFFNFRPFEIIRQYLTELMTKLKPGGAIIFTFNNCDNAHGVALCEKTYACYTPGKMVIELAKMIGYEVTYIHDTGGSLCWMEIVKPGELVTLRGGQNLAKIVPK